MREILVVLQDTYSNADESIISLMATESSFLPGPVSRQIPPSIDRGQAYYWSYRWQLGEQESRAELGSGQGVTFESAADAIRWLLSADK